MQGTSPAQHGVMGTASWLDGLLPAGSVFVDVQAAFDRLLTTYYPATINWDRVHPNNTGSALIARAFLTAIGFDWQRGLEGV